ncbi:hypothetical protein [Ruegeria hyattellae]|uniref:hypothetical protein n=1 Tax=Ruegeria hyattellae TaxID=3233337 RepID=UPI00355BC5C7
MAFLKPSGVSFFDFDTLWGCNSCAILLLSDSNKGIKRTQNDAETPESWHSRDQTANRNGLFPVKSVIYHISATEMHDSGQISPET